MKKLSVRELCLIALFTALTAVMAQIAVPIPFSPVPISFGMIGIYMAGMLLAPRCAVLSQLVYLLLGAFGAPVFHNFTGGFGILFGPTGGYLFAYPLMAAIIAAYFKFAEQRFAGQKKSALYVGGAVAALVVATALLYALGTLWLSILLQRTFVEALAIGVLPYVALDALKIAFTALAVLPLRQRLAKQRLLTQGR